MASILYRSVEAYLYLYHYNLYHCNLQRHKKTTGSDGSFLSPKCSLEDEPPNYHVGNCKLYQDMRVKYFGITKTTVHDVVAKCNVIKLATNLKEAGRLSEFDQ